MNNNHSPELRVARSFRDFFPVTLWTDGAFFKRTTLEYDLQYNAVVVDDMVFNRTTKASERWPKAGRAFLSVPRNEVHRLPAHPRVFSFRFVGVFRSLFMS